MRIDLLHFAVELFNKKACGFANREGQVVRGPNLSSTTFE
jgi:hypothetical protein